MVIPSAKDERIQAIIIKQLGDLDSEFGKFVQSGYVRRIVRMLLLQCQLERVLSI